MYEVSITNDGIRTTIQNPMPMQDAPKLLSGMVRAEINSIPSFTMELLPNNPGFLKVWPYKTMIEVKNLDSGKIEFEGRVLIPSPEMNENGEVLKSVICEGVKGFLQDTIQPYQEKRMWSGDATRTGLEEFIDFVLDNHNSQVEEYKKIYRGTVTVKTFESANNVTKGTNYQRTFDCLKEKLIDAFGGEIEVSRRADGKLYLDYSEKFGSLCMTPVKLARNMKSIVQEPDPTEIVTRLTPLGAKLKIQEENEDGTVTERETEERLTIESVNGGVKFLIHQDAEDTYGVHSGKEIWDEVTTAAELKKKGEQWLIDNNRIKVKNKITALDLAKIDERYERFELYNTYPIINELLGIDDEARVIRREIDVVDYAKSSLTFGDRAKLLSDVTLNQEKEFGKANEVIYHIKSDYEINKEKVQTTIDSLQKSLKLELMSNFGAYQKATKTGDVSPDYTVTPLAIAPKAWFKGAVQTENVTYIWKRKTGYEEGSLITGESVENNVLMVRHNLVDSVRYICYATYAVSETEKYVANDYLDFTAVADGDNGADAVSITGVSSEWAVSASNTLAPSSWSLAKPERKPGEYLWIRDIITLSNGTAQHIGARVVTGDPGDSGGDGVSVTGITSWYAVGNSNTAPPDSGWKEGERPARQSGQYLWEKQEFHFSNGRSEMTLPVCRTGDAGDDGEDGKDAAIISPNEPSDKTYLWCDTSTSPPTLKQWDGNDWIIVNDSAEQIMQVYSDIVTMISDAEGKIKLDIRKDTYTKEEVEDLLATQEASFTGTYKGFLMDFTEFKKQVGADQSTTNTKFEEWQKYIRFEDGSIILGVVGNPMTAILKNNRLSFLQNNFEVAYISDNALYIRHAVVTDDLTVGQVMQKQLLSGYYVFTRA